jgi:hypothetical protein
MLSVRLNRFLVCSVSDKIVSAYAQHAHAIIFENHKKSQIKIQISTIKNPNFEKPFRNPSNRTQVNNLKKKILGYLSKKIWFRVCSVTAKMFELRNSVENWRKEAKKISRIYQGHIRIWFRSKKFKIISWLCIFKITSVSIEIQYSLFSKDRRDNLHVILVLY